MVPYAARMHSKKPSRAKIENAHNYDRGDWCFALTDVTRFTLCENLKFVVQLSTTTSHVTLLFRNISPNNKRKTPLTMLPMVKAG
jgi:hypothetical protein